MKEFAELLQGIAALLWPILTFVLLLIFRREIVDVARRLKRGKFLGQELELDKSLDQLEEKAKAAAEQVPELPVVNEQKRLGEADADKPAILADAVQNTEPDSLDIIQKIIDLANSSPRLGLILLSSEIDKEVRRRLATMGLLERQRHHLASDLKFFESSLPKSVMDAVHDFQAVRNKIVHGHKADPHDVIRAIDSGLTILKALKSLPSANYFVYHPGTNVYEDKECTQLRRDCKGLILEAVGPGGAQKTLMIYPTTRTHFEEGMQVAWEWNLNKVWGETWYRDPDSGEVKYAWTSAGEFVGRNLEDL